MDYEISLCCPPGPENGTVLKLQCSADDWHLDYKDLPFTSSIEIECTNNSTWVMLSEIETTDFCSDGSLKCSHPKLPNCQDRTVLCMEPLPVPADMIQTNLTSNYTLHSSNFNYCAFNL